jgi:hypothetical protein
MKHPRVIIKNQRQKIAIPLPHGQLVQRINWKPREGSFVIRKTRDTSKLLNPENKAEPILPPGAETRPVDCPPQEDFVTFNFGFLPNLSAQATQYIFIGMHLAPKSIVFIKMMIITAGVSVNEEGLGAIRR